MLGRLRWGESARWTRWSSFLEQMSHSLLRQLFPPQCCHCKQPHNKLGVPLCYACVSYLEVRPSQGEILVTFEASGPANSLMSLIKKGSGPQLCSLLAAYMTIQYAQSCYQLPDIITAVPTSQWRKWQIGHAVSAALAQNMAQLVERPLIHLLERKKQMMRQDLLTREQREDLSAEEFRWKKHLPFQEMRGKTILLIDDTITTGTTLACCAERLWEAAPAQIIKMACVDRGYLEV